MSKPRLKVGIQCQERDEEVYRYNRELLPIVVKSINITDREHYVRLAADNPGVELVYRQVPNGSWDNPEDDGRGWAKHLYSLIGHIPEITLVEGHNEWIHAPPHNTPEDYDRADRFMAALIDGVHDLWKGRTHAVVLNASCGHFNEDIVDFFPRTLTKLQVCEKCLLALHEYDHPNKDMLGDGSHSLCGKFLRNLAGLGAAGYDKVRIAITECGVDSGVNGSGHIGFKYWGEGASERYLNERNLAWYIPLVQETDGVAWVTLYGCGMHGDWASFDIKGTTVIDGIGQIYSNWTPPEPEPPEPPNGGEHVIPSRVKIYDFDHGPGDAETRDQAWLESIFGECINVHPVTEIHTPAVGDVVYLLEWINCKPATVSCIIEVKDVYGNPAIGETVLFGWETADPHGLVDNGWNWTHNGAVGLTEAPDGHVGPAMSKDSYYSPDLGECGAHFVWIWGRPSEMVDGIGLLPFHDLVPGANHLHVELGYRAFTWGGEEPPEPPGPPTDGELLKVQIEARDFLEEIRDLLKADAPEPPSVSAFQGEYFNNRTLGGAPALTREDAEIDFFWGEGSPGPGVGVDNFSVRWTATRAFAEGQYRFKVLADDGVRLWVAGQLLIDAWRDQPPTTYEADATLSAAQHDIKMEYYERGGGSTIRLWWERVI